MSKREPQLIVATGTKGVGKTYETCKLIEDYLTSNLEIGKKARKVLIFDVNMEYTNAELEKNGHRFRTEVLALKDLPEWVKQKRVEVRRILPVDINGNVVGTDKILEILTVILEYARGGMLLLEDINRYLTDTNKRVIGLLTTNRHRDLDIIIHLQSLSPVTQTMFQNMNAVRFHYQTDPVDRIKGRIPNFELFEIAQQLVSNERFSGNLRFSCYVMIQMDKIRGRFSKKQFVEACRHYIEQHPNYFKGVYLKYPKTYDGRLQALKECVKSLIDKYYGNPQPKKEEVQI